MYTTNTVNEQWKNTRSLKMWTEHWDAFLHLHNISAKKLDGETRKSHECQLKNPKEPQKIEELLKFIEARCMLLDMSKTHHISRAAATKTTEKGTKNQLQFVQWAAWHNKM